VPSAAPSTTCATYEGSAPPETWAAVTALFVAAFAAAPYGEDPQELAHIQTWGPTQLSHPGGRLTVAEQGGRPAGFALVHGLVEDQPWQAILATLAGHPAAVDALDRPEEALVVHEVAVHEGFRGRGVARTLLREVLRDRDEARVFIGVYESAEDAVAMYERWGLVRAGSFRGPDSDVTLLVLTSLTSDLVLRLSTPSKRVSDR
jgi:ribosomal protein S18 acetylase RimI-like enzyme